MLNPYGRQINGGPRLGSLVQKDMRQVNPGPPMQPQGLPATSGGGLARLMQMYGRGAFGRASMVHR